LPLQFKELWELQQIDTEIFRLTRERSRLDNGAALRQASEAAARTADEAEARLRRLRTDLADAELELKKIEGKKADFERRLYEGKVTNPKELTAMEQEIAMLGRQRGRLDEQVLTLMDSIETTSTELAQAQAHRDQAEARWREQDELFRRESARLDAELAALGPRREAAAKALEPPTLARYENLRSRLSNVAVARVVDSGCGACHTHLASGIVRRVQEGQSYVYCENCTRFLVPGGD
jgi:predicted  nucleic acid-binding Zn-ribbon protein